MWESDSDEEEIAPQRPARPATQVDEEVITLAELARRESVGRKAAPAGDDALDESVGPVVLSRGSSAGLAARALAGMLGRRR